MAFSLRNCVFARYLKVQLEDLKDYQKALEYIGRLEFFEVRKTDRQTDRQTTGWIIVVVENDYNTYSFVLKMLSFQGTMHVILIDLFC